MRVWIIGHSGQDGHYLFELLAAKSYEVLGTSGRSARANFEAGVEPIDVRNAVAVCQFVERWRPDEIYYLAAYHSSSEAARAAGEEVLRQSLAVNTHGFINVLAAVSGHHPSARILYAASSHVFGDPEETPQTEATPLRPVCEYGISKAAGLEISHLYRRQHSAFVAAAIFYNHESPRRKPSYLSRKIVSGAVAIKLGRADRLRLGALGAAVDWGYAPDYVDAAWRILQLDSPDDFVVATGRLHTVAEFAELAFSALGLDWRHHTTEEATLIKKSLSHNRRVGDYAKLHRRTGWQPTAGLREIVDLMIRYELEISGRSASAAANSS